jgi:hypothetical protein
MANRQAVDEHPQVEWQRRLKDDTAAENRVLEFQAVGVQRVAAGGVFGLAFVY